jgi:hypothetical protein
MAVAKPLLGSSDVAAHSTIQRREATPLVPSQPVEGAEMNQLRQLLVNAKSGAEL